MSRNNVNAVFYANTYHPIQAGSIDGTDTLPHDNAVYRALICSSTGLYDPFGDPKIIGDPYCTLFVGRLSRTSTEETLRRVMSKYGTVKNLRLVRDIVTGASHGYAFVEFESDREMRNAYEEAHHSIIDDSEIIVDYCRQQLMPGWIPRRLGGGLGGKKESGQLRFGGRERPFRAPLQPIPYDDLKRLGISPPPEGKYMSRAQCSPVRCANSPVLSRVAPRILGLHGLRSVCTEPVELDGMVPAPPRRKRSSLERDPSKERHPRKHKHRRHSHYRSQRSRSMDVSSSDEAKRTI